MRHGLWFKIFTCFVCISFSLLMGGFSAVQAEGKTNTPLIGEMMAWGDVKFEARENVWKNVEPSAFPVFQGMKIRTDKGHALISLADRTQLEIGPETSLFFEEKDHIRVLGGKVDFRLSPQGAWKFRVGNLTLSGEPTRHANKNIAFVPKAEEAMGSIILHPHGAVTFKNIQGKLAVSDQGKIVLAAISSKESLTLPAVILEKNSGDKPSPVKIAQVGGAGETAAKGAGKAAGWSTGTWVAIGLGVLAVGGGIALAAGGGGGGGSSSACQ